MADIEHKWSEIGTALGLPFGYLQGLRNNPGTDNFRLTSVINKWCDTTKDPKIPSWSVVLDAVEGPIVNIPRIAQQIREWLAKKDQFDKYMEKIQKK